MSPDNEAHTGDEPDYVALAASAEGKANSVNSLHQAALWRELAGTYRELAAYRRRNAIRKLRRETEPCSDGRE